MTRGKRFLRFNNIVGVVGTTTESKSYDLRGFLGKKIELC